MIEINLLEPDEPAIEEYNLNYPENKGFSEPIDENIFSKRRKYAENYIDGINGLREIIPYPEARGVLEKTIKAEKKLIKLECSRCDYFNFFEDELEGYKIELIPDKSKPSTFNKLASDIYLL